MALQVGPEHAAQEAGQRPQAVVVQGRRPLAEVVHEQVADRAAGEPVAVDELAGGGGAVGAQLGQRGRGLLAEHSDPAQHPVEHPGPVCLPRVDLRLDVEQLQHVAHGDLGHRAAMILAAKGGPMAEITVGDVLELFDVEAQVNAREAHGAGVFYRMLRGVGMLGEQAPATLAQLRTDGPATPGQLIDRYRLACRPVRDLLVDYLSERAPALDYNSLRSLARFLGSVFWADLERHHPGIDSLHLPIDVAGGAAGGAAAAPATRVGYRECLTPVRAFYLDLACWAGEDPARWARWVAPCPIGAEEIHRRKAVLARKARMDARTRARLPALPALLDILSRQRAEAALALATARATPPGQTCPVGAQVLRRCQLRAPREATVWVDELATGRRRDLALEEDHAFWVWAAVEVLRSTGARIEELLELGHHALISYRLPTTGEVVPLLQIVPSKTDAERLLLVSPELADVLAAVLHRIRDAAGVVPLVARYDAYECVWSAPAPLLFQRRVGSEPRAMTVSGLRRMLAATLWPAPAWFDPATGGPLHFT